MFAQKVARAVGTGPFARLLWLYAIAWILLVVASVAHVWLSHAQGYFTRVESLIEVLLKDGVPVALVAVGASLVLSTAGVDLSSAGVATASGVLFAVLTQYGLPVWLASILASFLGIGTGSFLGFCARERVSTFIASWSVGLLLILFSVYYASSEFNTSVRGTVSSVPLGAVAIDANWTTSGSAIYVSLSLLLLSLAVLVVSNLPRQCRAVARVSTLHALSAFVSNACISTPISCQGLLLRWRVLCLRA